MSVFAAYQPIPESSAIDKKLRSSPIASTVISYCLKHENRLAVPTDPDSNFVLKIIARLNQLSEAKMKQVQGEIEEWQNCLTAFERDFPPLVANRIIANGQQWDIVEAVEDRVETEQGLLLKQFLLGESKLSSSEVWDMNSSDPLFLVSRNTIHNANIALGTILALPYITNSRSRMFLESLRSLADFSQTHGCYLMVVS